MSGSPSGLVPRTNNSSLGLGATGGPRGFGAGVIQVLANFAFTYDKGRLEQINKDLQKVQADQTANAQQLAKFTGNQQQLERSLQRIQQARLQIANASGQTAKQTNTLLNKAIAEQRQHGAIVQSTGQQLRTNLAALEQSGVITSQQVALLQNEYRIRQAMAAAERGVATETQRSVLLETERLALLREQQTIQNVGRAGLSRIGALSLGLIGGTVGGALTSGLIMGPIQAAMDGIAEGLQDIIDPARHAREAIGDVRSEIDQLTDQGRLNRMQAAAEYLERIGAASFGSDVNAEDLGLSAAIDKYLEDIGEVQKADTAAEHTTTRFQEAVGKSAEVLLDAAVGSAHWSELLHRLRSAGDGAVGTTLDWNLALNGNISALRDLAAQGSPWAQSLLAQAEANARAGVTARQYGTDLEELSRQAQVTTDYIRQLNQELLNTSIGGFLDSTIGAAQNQLDSMIEGINARATAEIRRINYNYDQAIERIRDDADQQIAALQKQMDNLDSGPSERTQALQRRLEALKDAEPSKRTRELAEAIEKLNEAQRDAAFQSQLADIDRQRELILLRERLRVTNEQIDLDDYQGRERLVAIEALLDRQRKQNEAQDRFNKLLDIQYNIGRGVRRQQGETIQDFISRRAQYYRELLQQAAELRREGPLADLEQERERVQTSIDLKELEERRRKLIEDRARQEHLDNLRERLEASRERDREELESRRESLQKQLEASREADRAALEAAREALRERMDAIRENSANAIEVAERERDNFIRAAEERRDAQIIAAEQAMAVVIKALETQAEQTRKWTDFGNIQALNEAIKGAQNMAQLQALSGQVSGMAWVINYLRQTGIWMGWDASARDQLVGSYMSALTSYSRQLNLLQQRATPPPSPVSGSGGQRRGGGGYAEGGVFWADNTNTPVGKDVRWGDSNGKELGVILSNAVVRKLEEGRGGGPLVGTMNIASIENPRRVMARQRREMRQLIREESR